MQSNGGEARVESHNMLLKISCDADVLAVHVDEKLLEEASEKLSAVPGWDRARGLHEILC